MFILHGRCDDDLVTPRLFNTQADAYKAMKELLEDEVAEIAESDGDEDCLMFKKKSGIGDVTYSTYMRSNVATLYSTRAVMREDYSCLELEITEVEVE